jgi:hypothetical protein
MYVTLLASYNTTNECGQRYIKPEKPGQLCAVEWGTGQTGYSCQTAPTLMFGNSSSYTSQTNIGND